MDFKDICKVQENIHFVVVRGYMSIGGEGWVLKDYLAIPKKTLTL